jgi:hypothetical protein
VDRWRRRPGHRGREASRILEDHFELITFPQTTPEEAAAERDETRPRPEQNANLLRNVAELEVSVRASNCFKAANIRTMSWPQFCPPCHAEEKIRFLLEGIRAETWVSELCRRVASLR